MKSDITVQYNYLCLIRKIKKMNKYFVFSQLPNLLASTKFKSHSKSVNMQNNVKQDFYIKIIIINRLIIFYEINKH